MKKITLTKVIHIIPVIISVIALCIAITKPTKVVTTNANEKWWSRKNLKKVLSRKIVGIIGPLLQKIRTITLLFCLVTNVALLRLLIL